MKFSARLLLFTLAVWVTPLWAALESIKIEVTEEPEMPAVLRMNGLSNGRVVVVIEIGPEGKLVDWLVVTASHKELIKSCVTALQNWRYTPAKYDGQPVMAQMQLTIEISQTGAVVSRNSVEIMEDLIELVGGRRSDYQVCPASEIDRSPGAVKTVAPRYAAEAEKEGVRGRVKVHFYIDELGAVRMPAVSAEAHPYLSSVAIEALKGWKFAPPTRNGKPVMVAAAQAFDFGTAP